MPFQLILLCVNICIIDHFYWNIYSNVGFNISFHRVLDGCTFNEKLRKLFHKYLEIRGINPS